MSEFESGEGNPLNIDLNCPVLSPRAFSPQPTNRWRRDLTCESLFVRRNATNSLKHTYMQKGNGTPMSWTCLRHSFHETRLAISVPDHELTCVGGEPVCTPMVTGRLKRVIRISKILKLGHAPPAGLGSLYTLCWRNSHTGPVDHQSMVRH